MPGEKKPMLKVGLLVGQERSFPDSLIQEINRRNANVKAEYVRIGTVSSSDLNSYSVILDRISHEVPFYQAYLKAAVLSGTEVINNPFWRIADDKFFGTALAERIGVAAPRTLVIPSQSYAEGIVEESLSNLIYPLDWQAVVNYTGLPAILKPHWGGGWKDVHRVDSIEQLLSAYNNTGRVCMILQEFINWELYVRCICIGKTNVLVTNWDPRKPHHERYRDPAAQDIAPALKERIVADAIKLNEALGYDMNTVEFGIRDGIPYAIDFMNSAPDFDIRSLTETYFPWVVNSMADLVISRAVAERKPAWRWDKFLGIAGS